jgi:hypothetical protein
MFFKIISEEFEVIDIDAGVVDRLLLRTEKQQHDHMLEKVNFIAGNVFNAYELYVLGKKVLKQHSEPFKDFVRRKCSELCREVQGKGRVLNSLVNDLDTLLELTRLINPKIPDESAEKISPARRDFLYRMLGIVVMSEQKMKSYRSLVEFLRAEGVFQDRTRLYRKVDLAEAKRIDAEIGLKNRFSGLMKPFDKRKTMKVINTARILIYLEDVLYPLYLAEKEANEDFKTFSTFLISDHAEIYGQCSHELGMLYPELGGLGNLLLLCARSIQDESIVNEDLLTKEQQREYLREKAELIAGEVFAEYEVYVVSRKLFDEIPVQFPEYVREKFPELYLQAQDETFVLNRLVGSFAKLQELARESNPKIPAGVQEIKKVVPLKKKKVKKIA